MGRGQMAWPVPVDGGARVDLNQPGQACTEDSSDIERENKNPPSKCGTLTFFSFFFCEATRFFRRHPRDDFLPGTHTDGVYTQGVQGTDSRRETIKALGLDSVLPTAEGVQRARLLVESALDRPTHAPSSGATLGDVVRTPLRAAGFDQQARPCPPRNQ